jgi:GTPase
MALPIVAIVGRPNVGKSSLFNWLAGRRISIVDPTAGVTRDRISTTLHVDDQYFDLVDTGGMGIEDKDNLTDDVEQQIRIAIDLATVVLFVVDVRDGVVPLDEDVAQRLRSINKPIVFVANKYDDSKFDLAALDLYRLGYGEPLLVSAEQKIGKTELLDAILQKLPANSKEPAPESVELKLAIVGRRNVGKSTFINQLAQEERVIVSEVAGTTRDSIDVRFERDGKTFLAIDTAGVRKRKSLADSIEFYSLHRAERSIRRADVVLLFLDPRLRISRVDKQLAEYVIEHHKPAIFVVNKWDLAREKTTMERWGAYLRKIFSMLDYVPIAFITAKEGKNVYRLLNLAQNLHKQAGRRARTGELNRVLQQALLASSPPMRQNRVPKIYYATQVATHPPTIVLVTNGPDLFDGPYLRYLSKTLRDNFRFRDVAIKLVLRSKKDGGRGGSSVAPEEGAEPSLEDTLVIPELSSEPIVEEIAEELEKPVDKKPRRKKKRNESETWDL